VSSIGVVPVNAQTSTSIWASTCDLTEANANTYLSAYRYACENVGSGGATFSGGVTTDKLNLDGTWTYCAKYSCNACTSVEIQTKKSALTDSCTAECLTTNFMCSATGAFTYNLNLADCSETPLTTGVCAESSSSIESSSSGESSSSVASSSSDEGGSSASEPTSSTSVTSSGSVGGVSYYADVCLVKSSPGACFHPANNTWLLATAPMIGSVSVGSSYCRVNDGLLYFVFATDMPYFSKRVLLCYSSSDCSTSSYVDAYNVSGGTLTSSGVLSDGSAFQYFYCDASTCYLDDDDSYLPSNVSVSQIYDLADSAARLAGFSNRVAYANYCKSIYSSSSATPISSSSIDGSSSSEGAYESSSSGSEETGSSSSGNDEISSSSASDAGSSSSTEINSSTSGTETGESSGSVSSSSEVPYESYSSNSDEISSSSMETESSSSADAMSSSYEQSSSSGDLCPQHPLASVPADPFSACFSYGGKCYQCNDDRGSECANDWLWIYSFNSSNVGWWYTEVDCETGSEKTTDEGIGVCPSHPLNKVPSDPQNACFAKDGKCYKCNDDRGSECGNDWLWIYGFNASNVGWWYTEVDCYDPFDEEEQCPEEFYLQKKVVQNGGQLDTETSEDPVELIPQIKFYDALGRRITNSPKSKRALYTLKTNVILKMNEEISLTGERYVYIPIELFQRKSWALMKTSETVTSCGTAWNIQNDSICDSNGSWYYFGKKCGVEGVDYGVYNSEGGIDVGVYCGEVYFMAKRVSHYLVIRQSKDTIGTCADGTNLIRAKFTIPVETKIVRDYHRVAPVGYQIGNNFIVSYSLHDSIDWHEKGHKRFYHCLIDENMFDPAIEFSMNVCERDFTCEGKTFDPENQEIVNSFNTSYEAEIKTIKNRDTKEWLQMCGWYHDKYGHTDGPRDPDTHQHIDPYDISCPSAEDLEKDYDLSGCEVDW